MAEDLGFVRVWRALDLDPAWLRLHEVEQGLYQYLLRKCDRLGVLQRFDPGMYLRARSSAHNEVYGTSLNKAQVEHARAVLEERRFIVRDHATGDILVRTYIKHNWESLAQKKYHGALAKLAKPVEPKLKLAILDEILKMFDDQPDDKYHSDRRNTLTGGVEYVRNVVKNLIPTVEEEPEVEESAGGLFEIEVERETLDYSILDDPRLIPLLPGSTQDPEGKVVSDLIRKITDACAAAHLTNEVKYHWTPQWRTEAKAMLLEDQRDVNEIVALIQWASNDEFWHNKLRTPGQVRRNWDNARADQRSKSKRRKLRPETNIDYVNTDGTEPGKIIVGGRPLASVTPLHASGQSTGGEESTGTADAGKWE